MPDVSNIGDYKVEIKKLVADIAEKTPEEITDNARFSEDLGIDSMMALEIIASIEKKYKVIIPEGEIPKMRAVQKIYDVVGKVSLK